MRDWERGLSYLLPLLFCLTFQLIVFASTYSNSLQYGLTLLCGILVFSICMAYFTISSRSLHLLMTWESLTLFSALLICFVHSDLSLVAFYKVILYNALPSVLALFVTTQGSVSYHSCSLWIGCIWIKSVIWFLHGWLIEAMSCPILVSSLLHSATLVIAGSVLLSKLGVYVSFPWFTIMVIVSAGWMMFTIFSSSSDLKWTLAFSTAAHIAVITLFSGANSSAGGDVVFEGGYRILHGLVKFELFLFCGSMLASSVWYRSSPSLPVSNVLNAVMGCFLHFLVSVSQLCFHSLKVESGGFARSELPLGALEWSVQLLLSMSYTIYAQTYNVKDVRFVWPGSSCLVLIYPEFSIFIFYDCRL